MKGTLPDGEGAAERLMADAKEAAEHATVVDLLRNDLSRVAEHVRVERYRYVERVITHRGPLLQTSSEIAGRLPADYSAHLGEILFRLLPAGSVTGAPKRATCRLIAEAEGYDRGWYTGIAGWSDGRTLDSAVLIRFVEQTPEGLVFKAGGGITAHSREEREYAEIRDKNLHPLLKFAADTAICARGNVLFRRKLRPSPRDSTRRRVRSRRQPVAIGYPPVHTRPAQPTFSHRGARLRSKMPHAPASCATNLRCRRKLPRTSLLFSR